VAELTRKLRLLAVAADAELRASSLVSSAYSPSPPMPNCAPPHS
jgi:hypothetical protein